MIAGPSPFKLASPAVSSQIEALTQLVVYHFFSRYTAFCVWAGRVLSRQTSKPDDGTTSPVTAQVKIFPLTETAEEKSCELMRLFLLGTNYSRLCCWLRRGTVEEKICGVMNSREVIIIDRDGYFGICWWLRRGRFHEKSCGLTNPGVTIIIDRDGYSGICWWPRWWPRGTNTEVKLDNELVITTHRHCLYFYFCWTPCDRSVADALLPGSCFKKNYFIF